MWSSPERSLRMREWHVVGRQQILRHLARGKRHAMLKPPGQKAENGSRDNVRLHGKWKGTVLISQRHFALFGRKHVCKILLDQFLKATTPLSTHHQFVELRVRCRMLKQTKKVGRRMLDREGTGGQMLLMCYQFVKHLSDALFKQGILILIMLVKGGAMNHRALTDLLDGNLLKWTKGQLRH